MALSANILDQSRFTAATSAVAKRLLLLSPASLPAVLLLAPLAMAWLLPCFAVAFALPGNARDKNRLRCGLGTGWTWLPLMILAAVSGLWAIDRSAAFLLAARLWLLTGSGIVILSAWQALPLADQDRLVKALGWGTIAAGCLVSLDLAIGGKLAQFLHPEVRTTPLADVYSRGAVVLAIVTAPLARAIWRRKAPRLAVAVLIASCLPAIAGVQAAAWLALAVAGASIAVVAAMPKLRWLWLAAILAGGVGAPWILPHAPSPRTVCWLLEHKPSALHRLLIWDWVDQRIAERPLLGWGLDAARRMPGGHDRIVLHGCTDPPSRRPRLDNEVLPLHPHDAALQVWLELGASGMAAAALALGGGLSRTLRRARIRWDAAIIAAALAAAAATAGLSFGIWQEWWFASLWLAAWVVAMALPPVDTESEREVAHGLPTSPNIAMF